MNYSARLTAVIALETLQRHRRPAAEVLDEICTREQVLSIDRNLAMNIVYGVLRQREYLSRLLQQFCRKPIRSLHPRLRLILLCGLYQLMFLDRMPPSAIINESVETVKEFGLTKPLQGLVNAVLRNCLREKPNLPGPAEFEATETPVTNHPAWLVARWQTNFGLKTAREICTVNNSQPPLCLRITSGVDRNDYLQILVDAGIHASPGDMAPNSVLIWNYRGAIVDLPGYHRGHFVVQDQAAQLAVMLLGPFSSQCTYLDGCAGVGGKSLQIADMCEEPPKELMCVEPHPGRFHLLKANFARCQAADTVTFVNKTLEEVAQTRNPPLFERIFIDAPCSGTGIIRRQPDIRWHRRADDIKRCAQRQLALLKSGAELLASNGVLVYATCSIEPEENGAVIERFLSEHDRFSVTDIHSLLPAAAHDFIVDGCFAPLPSTTMDGFFGARLVKVG
jgi:16S rRNA (cytosine967-C5)-methyltransferase